MFSYRKMLIHLTRSGLSSSNHAHPLDHSDFNSQNSLIHLANLKQKVFFVVGLWVLCKFRPSHQ